MSPFADYQNSNDRLWEALCVGDLFLVMSLKSVFASLIFLFGHGLLVF